MTDFTAHILKNKHQKGRNLSLTLQVYHNSSLLTDKPFKINNLSEKYKYNGK